MGAKAGRHEADVLGRSSYEKGRAFFCAYHSSSHSLVLTAVLESLHAS